LHGLVQITPQQNTHISFPNRKELKYSEMTNHDHPFRLWLGKITDIHEIRRILI